MAKAINHYCTDQQRKALWASMRRLRQFTAVDLEASAECDPHTVNRWMIMCHKAGMIAPAGPKPCTGPRYKRWRLVRDTGPLTPVQVGAGLVDANLHPERAMPGEQPVSMPRAEYEHALRCVRACAGMTDEELERAALVRGAPLEGAR